MLGVRTMKMSSNLIVTFLLFYVTIMFLSKSVLGAEEVDDQSGFDYVQGSGKGPEQWGDLRPDWIACKNGTMQSPIDLLYYRTVIDQSLGELIMNYNPANATLKNRGHDIQLVWSGSAGSIQINGTNYFLQSVHWHSPSEHTIDGQRYALEMHLVHESSTGVTAVVGLVYNIGQPDTFLLELEANIALISGRRKEVNVGVVDPNHINVCGGEYYRYMGSLTTPPCSENVIWTISKRVRTASLAQVKLLRKAVDDSAENNARPLQPLHNRTIQLYSLGHEAW